jgi:predicted metal-dependent phosphoesterase TrpH
MTGISRNAKTTHPGIRTVESTTGDPGLWKFDMHVHSSYSGDSANDPEAIVTSFRKTGVLSLVCDHNTTAGSAVVYHGIRRLAPDIPEILSEEIMTAEGEVIGLFLSDFVRPYLPARETIDIIHGQGGLVLVPHPFCSFRAGCALWRDVLLEIVHHVDIIEGFNARTPDDWENVAAREFAQRHGRPISVGSDSHLPENLGRFWLELEPFYTPGELMRSLSAGTVRYPVLHR